MKGRQISYGADEMAWLEANRTLPIADYRAGFCAAFGRDVKAVNLHALRKRKGWRTGRTGHFEKGDTPANKGKAMPFHPNSAATRFKKGERRGVAVRLYKPIGTERVTKDGYLERKVNDDLPPQARWRPVQHIRWGAVNGPLPAGHALKCMDDDRLNTDPSNWKAVPRAILPRLNGGAHKTKMAFDGAPAELKPTILALAQLAHKVKTVRRGRAA